MKNYFFITCAAVALTLSFFFEQSASTASTNPPPNQSESLLWADAEPTDNGTTLKPYYALAYQPVAKKELKKSARKTKKQSRRTAKRNTRRHLRIQADSLQMALLADNKLQEVAAQWLGTPYRSGRNSKRGTDCSGFVQKIYQQVYGISLSRSSRSMFQDVQPIAEEDLREGDLVFFKRKRGPIYHVGIYLKDGKFIHSASNGGVMVSSLNQGYYNRNFYAAGRVSNIN